ncbi:MAG TPA: hypothetical protein VKG62_02720 [Solirubrobacteraceae bacterium]|nr:hypothetical protein [Solirubrobacteraceae bacterium]
MSDQGTSRTEERRDGRTGTRGRSLPLMQRSGPHRRLAGAAVIGCTLVLGATTLTACGGSNVADAVPKSTPAIIPPTNTSAEAAAIQTTSTTTTPTKTTSTTGEGSSGSSSSEGTGGSSSEGSSGTSGSSGGAAAEKEKEAPKTEASKGAGETGGSTPSGGSNATGGTSAP